MGRQTAGDGREVGRTGLAQSFRPRGPIAVWTSANAVLITAIVVKVGHSGWAAVAAAVGMAVIVGVLVARHRLVIDSQTVSFGGRCWPLTDVRVIRAREHRLSRGQPIGLVFDLADGTSVSWVWISYRRTLAGNIMKQDLLGLRDQRYLERLVHSFEASEAQVRLPAFSRSLATLPHK